MDTDRLEGAAREVGGKVQSAAGRLTGNDGLRAEGGVREVAGRAQGLYGEAKDNVRHAVDEMSEAAHDALGQSGDYARQGARAVSRNVEAYPVVYLALAAAFGFLAALLLNERRR